MLRATLAWIALIFFSSTSLAARWCERAFNFLFGPPIGAANEFLQSLFPGRDPAIRDVLLNFTSMAVVTCVLSIKLSRSSPCPER